MNRSKLSLRIIALLENNPYPRDVRVRPHMEALADAGYQVAVICPHDQGQRWEEVINGVHVYRFWIPPVGQHVVSYLVEFFWATLVITFLTLWVWARQGMDVLHIYNPPESLFVAGLLPKLAGKIIVYDLRDIAPELYKSKFEKTNSVLYSLLVWMERVMSRLADHIIVVNDSYKKMLIDRDRVAPDRISVVRQAPDIHKIKLTEPEPNLRACANTIIAYLGSMAGQDGIDHLLMSLSHLDNRFNYRDWFCVLIGPAEDQAALEALAGKLGILDRTSFHGFMAIDQWLPILSTADICVEPCPANPLNNISTMNKIMDYMALRKPTVAYDLCEHHFTAGEAALYASPNDQIDFARKIFQLIDDSQLRTQMGQIGRDRMERLFAWEYQKQRLLDVYDDLMTKNIKRLESRL
jgi:glycosyltransferase involved in cell wall biosynthesis